MQFSLLALLSVVFAAPIAVESQPVGYNDSLEPLIYVSKDGSLWVGSDAKQKLSKAEAQSAVLEIARLTTTGDDMSNIGSTYKRDAEAIEPKIHFCFGNSCDRSSCNDCGCDPCDPCDPCNPCDPCDPCNPCDPCDPCDPSCCEGDNCRDELKASCYTKWMCPSTYCCGCDNSCDSGNHPVVDSLRSCCATKWMCPSTYCPSNWCCGNGWDCSNSCNDPCSDPCNTCDPCDPCCN